MLDGAPLLRGQGGARGDGRLFRGVWLLLGAAVVWHCWTAVYDQDEVEHLHAAWLISTGRLPYRDFMEHHNPTLWFLAAPIVGRFQDVAWLFFTARLACALAFVGTLSRVRAIVARCYPGVAWQWPVLLAFTSVVYFRSSVEVRPDTFMTFAWFAGLAHWMDFLDRPRLARAARAGLCFGAAMAILQKAIAPVGLVLGAGALLLVLRWARGQALRPLSLGLATLAACAALPVLALLLGMAALGLLHEYWFWNFPFNYQLHLHLDVLGFSSFSVLRNLGLHLGAAPVVWSLGVLAAARCAWSLWRGPSSPGYSASGESRDVTLLVVFVGYFILLCLMSFPQVQYFIVLVPLLAIFVARLVGSERPGRPWAHALQAAALVMVVVFGIILLQYPDNRAQRELQTALLRRVRVDQTLFAPPPYNPILRRDGAYFWFFASSFAGVYAEVCQQTSACADDKLAADERQYRASPWDYVLVTGGVGDSASWRARESSYAPVPLDPKILGDCHLLGRR